MKGQSFRTPEGEIINVEEFDLVNKIAYVHISSGQYKWYTEAEYSNWTSIGTAKPIPEYVYVPDIPAQMIVKETGTVELKPVDTEIEKPKKKRTIKAK